LIGEQRLRPSEFFKDGLQLTSRACARPSISFDPETEPHYKYILLNGEANTMQVCGKPYPMFDFK